MILRSDLPNTGFFNSPTMQTFYESIRCRGISRRGFLKFCSVTAASMGLAPAYASKIAHAMETKPRIPVPWYHGNECTCCSESFIRSAHPLVGDVVMSMINLEYDDLIMAAAGHQAEAIPERVMRDHPGEYVLAVEGDPPLAEDGMYCFVGGKPFVENLKRAAEKAAFVVSWGQCASFGCVQTAHPNPTRGTPVHKIIRDKPVVNVPGCPPTAEVMTGVLSYVLAFGHLPALDRKGRPQMFYSHRIHDKCYRRGHFDAGQFVERWDDEGARKGYCLYKMAARGRPPTTPARRPCGTRAPRSTSAPATAAWAAPRRASGTTARSTTGAPPSVSSRSRRRPTRWAARSPSMPG